MRYCLLTLLVVAYGSIGSANADIKKGATELAIFGNVTSIKFEDGGTEDAGALAVGLGYFHTRQVEFGVHGMGNWSKDLDLYSFGGNVKYHFTPDLRLFPTLEVSLIMRSTTPTGVTSKA